MTVNHVQRLRQRGQIIIITVLLVGLAAGFSVYGLSRPRNPVLDDAVQTGRALALARDALISYSLAAVSATSRPGALPCPDRSGNGSASTCNNVGRRIGLLPWKTLGIPELRDGSGAPLLYAVSNVHRSTTGILNSDTSGDYTVTGLESATGVIAVIFAPGTAVGNQRRDATVAACATTGTNIARNLCPANYLEGGNDDGNTSFVTAAASASFNDKLLLITTDNLYPAVTTYVARRAREALNTFYTSMGRFPYAANMADSAYNCTVGVTQGRLAQVTNDTTACPLLSGSATLPNWFSANNWHQLIFYAVSPLCVSTATAASCQSTGGLSLIGGAGNVRSLLIVSGRAYTGQARPCVTALDCLEDDENRNGDSVFQSPSLSTTNNDRLVVVAP